MSLVVVSVSSHIVAQGKPYRAFYAHRTMLIQTLKLLGNNWCANGTYRRKKEKLKKVMHMACWWMNKQMLVQGNIWP